MEFHNRRIAFYYYFEQKISCVEELHDSSD